MGRTIIKYVIFCVLCLVCASDISSAQDTEQVSTKNLVRSVFEMGKNHCDLDFYAGTLMLHGMSEFALLDGNEQTLAEIISIYQQFESGEIEAHGNFISYEAGGSGSAYLSWKESTQLLDELVHSKADKMMSEQKRTHDNLMTAPNLSHQMFIDVVFAVSPFLLYSGLKFDKPEYVDYAVFQTLESFRILHDEETGLVHQGRGFQGKGIISEDCWSRGNGWGAFALAILARDLPNSHPQRQEVEKLARQFFTAVLNYQNEQGLWYQEMTAPESYVETSGSGLLLYGLGLVIEAGILDQRYFEDFKKGIESYTSYVGSDGSVSHTSFACRCPKDGSKEVYINHPWVYNDHHAFGPAVLAFTQASKMGIETIVPSEKLGKYTITDSPETPRSYVRFARESDLAWENDKVAFRIFNSAVRGKVGNGIDVWAKSVAYPVLDKWYALNERDEDYHVDRGEGLDFYNMGKRSGCGGLSVWIDEKPYAPETFDSYRIIQNQDNEIEFDVRYNTWSLPNLNLREHRKVEMEKGSNLFKVTSTILSDNEQEIIVGLGLSTFGRAKIVTDNRSGFLALWEQMGPDEGSLGTAIILDPDIIHGFRSFDGDEFVLIKAITNQPFSYYAGAGWTGSKQFADQQEWLSYLRSEIEILIR